LCVVVSGGEFVRIRRWAFVTRCQGARAATPTQMGMTPLHIFHQHRLRNRHRHRFCESMVIVGSDVTTVNFKTKIRSHMLPPICTYHCLQPPSSHRHRQAASQIQPRRGRRTGAGRWTEGSCRSNHTGGGGGRGRPSRRRRAQCRSSHRHG
jgi:hypothetical protein